MLDTQKQILYALNQDRDMTNEEAAKLWQNLVEADDMIDANGNVVEAGKQGGTEAGFQHLNSAEAKDGKLVVFRCKVDGETKYVIPVYGNGLWGPISGFIAVNGDKTTVFGAYLRDEKGKMTAIEYTIYEQPQPPELDCPVLENPTADNPILENPTTDNPTSENPMQLNKDISRTNLQKKEKSNTDLSSTHSIPIHSLNPLPYGEDEAAQPPERKGTERNDAYRVYEEIIKDNIEYNILLQDMKFDHDRLNEIVDIILETVCTSRKKIRIAGDDYPAELVKSKFMKLDSEHIRFVLDCMQENTTKIRNIKQYLKAVLFNAPSTIDSYYTSLVAHDMASGALSGKPKYGDPDYYTYNEGESL